MTEAIRAAVDHWKVVVTGLVTILGLVWVIVTKADEVIRHADQVPLVAKTQQEHAVRLTDLEREDIRAAKLMEQLKAEQDTHNRQQMALMQEILREVRRGKN